MATTFAALHVAWWVYGLRPDAQGTYALWQVASEPWLREDLGGTLLALHSQPPLFNLIVGLLGRLPAPLAASFLALHLALGLGAQWSIARCAGFFGLGSRGALLVSALFVASPSFMLYEHWFFYTFEVACLLPLAALSLVRFLERPSPGRASAFFFLLALASLLRASFHPVFLPAVAVGLALLLREHRRLLLSAAVLPALLAWAPAVKNAVLVGRLEPSTWSGMNLARVALHGLSPAGCERLRTRGLVSDAFCIGPFLAVERYPPELRVQPPATAPAVLRELRKPEGVVNFNQASYVGISRQLLRDSVAALRDDPGRFARTALWSLGVYLTPTHEYGLLGPNCARVPGALAIDRLIAGEGLLALVDERLADLSPTLLLLLPALLIAGVARAAPTRGPLALEPGQRALAALCCGLVLACSLIAVCFEVGENNRFRFEIDGLFTILLALAVEGAWRLRWSTRTRAAPASPGGTPGRR